MSHGFHGYKPRRGGVKFNVTAAADHDIHSNTTYLENYGVEPYLVDFTKTSIDHMKDWILDACNNSPDKLILIGCAPCQGFSSHQKKRKQVTPDERNSLLVWFAELATKVAPAFIISENVPDLFCTKNWQFYTSYVGKLEMAGYTVSSGIANAAEFGTPQERHRALIVSSNRFAPSVPHGSLTPDNFVTVRDAIGHLPRIDAGRKCESDPMHETSKHRKSTLDIFKKIPKDGGSRPPGVGPKCLDKVAGFYDVYGRLWWDRPSVTITARCRTPSCGRFTHPQQDRGLTVREAACIQGFPDNFIFCGPFDDKFKQIGNAVPPPLSAGLASHLAKIIDGRRHNGDPGRISEPVAKSFSSVIAAIKMARNRENAAPAQ
jgi:DNA (cytosine-5)-methyltransferase 1